MKGAHQNRMWRGKMAKKSDYEIDGDWYKFNNTKLREIIQIQNSSRGAFEQFYRKVVSRNVGISYDAVKGWVTKDTNPASLDDVKELADVLEVPYLRLLEPTSYAADHVNTRLQRIRFDEVTDAFSLRYEGFSNVLDIIIGRGLFSSTNVNNASNIAERIIDILGIDEIEKRSFPELLGYRFVYSEDVLKDMSDTELIAAMKNGYVDDEGERLFDEEGKVNIDRRKFGKRLLENATWLDSEERDDLRTVIEEADRWWDYCDTPFKLLKIDINACGLHLAKYTMGPGWSKPTHEDRWRLLLDVLALLDMRVETAGLCWAREMHVDQFESEFFVTIETFKFFD